MWELLGPGMESVSPALADSYLLCHQGSPIFVYFMESPLYITRVYQKLNSRSKYMQVASVNLSIIAVII